jgi:MerR family transcriptional regulator, light-induced transcriptional regulator
MANRNLSMADTAVACGDWVPPPELQALWQSQPPNARVPDKHALLTQIIENDVIPRLLLANRPELAILTPAASAVTAKLAQRVGEFAELVISQDAQDAIAYFEILRDQGVSIEALFQDLLAPTARRLGELWDEDINDFLDVTRGIGHLQQIVRTFGNDFRDEISQPISSKRALLMPLPGDQHTFGLSLLREHFLREGWRVWCGPADSINDIVKLVKGQWFEMIGLSASMLEDPQELAKDIARIRKASLNKDMCVFVGGHAFNSQPELVAAVGADATASDGRQAVLQVTQRIAAQSSAA